MDLQIFSNLGAKLEERQTSRDFDTSKLDFEILNFGNRVEAVAADTRPVASTQKSEATSEKLSTFFELSCAFLYLSL